MKNFLLLLSAVILLASCKKDPDSLAEPSPYWGESSAIINGEDWTAQPTASIDLIHGNTWLVTMSFYDQFNILRSGLNLSNVPFIPGTYPAGKRNIEMNNTSLGATFTYWDGDQTDGYYTVLESDSSSFVTVKSYDSITKELRGTFDITFLAVHKPPYANAQDTLRVRNGSFHTKVRDK